MQSLWRFYEMMRPHPRLVGFMAGGLWIGATVTVGSPVQIMFR